MTIPEKLKIGAKVYDVEITNKLDLGNVNYSGEISYTDLVIRICPNAQAKMEADFLHEMIHGMLDHLGYTEHDEKKVDELANVLHMVILDNPAVFAPVKEGQQRTSFNEMRTYSDLRYAVCDYNSRRCGKDYRIVVLKTVEVKRVIDYDCEEGYAWK